MKLLLQSRSTLFSVSGGDTVQMVKTAEMLRKQGCNVEISTALEPDVSSYDVVHLFNLTRPQELYLQAVNAKKQGKKIVLSTIYVDYKEYDRKGRTGIQKAICNIVSPGHIEYLKTMARAIKNTEVNKGTLSLLKNGFRPLQENVIELSDVLLPNSESELKRIISDFPAAKKKPSMVIPNAVDENIFDPDAVKETFEFEKYSGCVLSVARIEGRKCQLNLVRAMNNLPWRLVLIGNPAPNHVSYFEQIKREAGPKVTILGPVEHDHLPRYYKMAKVHALISWMETTGLSSLEAGAMGCNLVITDKGDTRDYFGDYAFYCEPDSTDSIRNAIVRAYESPPSLKLREHILRNYTWERAAEKTIMAYKRALGY